MLWQAADERFAEEKKEQRGEHGGEKEGHEEALEEEAGSSERVVSSSSTGKAHTESASAVSQAPTATEPRARRAPTATEPRASSAVQADPYEVLPAGLQTKANSSLPSAFPLLVLCIVFVASILGVRAGLQPDTGSHSAVEPEDDFDAEVAEEAEDKQICRATSSWDSSPGPTRAIG